MPENVVVGSLIWVEDQELVWIDGQVIDINGEEAEIQTSNGKTVSWAHKMSNNFPSSLIWIESHGLLVQLSFVKSPLVLKA